MGRAMSLSTPNNLRIREVTLFCIVEFRNLTVNLVVLKVSKKPVGASNLKATEHSHFDPAKTSIKHVFG